MLQVTTTVTYKVPRGDHCQFKNGTLCRFVAPNGMGLRCTLHDEGLYALHGNVHRCDGCIKATRACGSTIEDNDINIEPDVVLRTAVNEYIKTYKTLRKRKYSEAMAISLAKEHILNEGW